jgi:hypothetical protein
MMYFMQANLFIQVLAAVAVLGFSAVEALSRR